MQPDSRLLTHACVVALRAFFSVAKPQNMPLVRTLLTAILLSSVGPAVACVPLDLKKVQPVRFFSDYVTNLFFGRIIANHGPEKHPQVTVSVMEQLKGKVENIVSLRSTRSRLNCGFDRGALGDTVMVEMRGNVVGIVRLDLTSSYADQLRAESERLQSNPTVGRDARKNGARPSP